ncbi:MAG: winged helix-turn-helix domain-containing protein [Pyrinomonadaceae bacterium]
MLEEIWAGSFVEENNLAQDISVLRRLLGETRKKKFIETVPKYGYRFVANVVHAGLTLNDVVVFEHTTARFFLQESEFPRSPSLVHIPAISSNIAGPLDPMRPETRYIQNGM